MSKVNNPFKQLNRKEEKVPENLKKEVMETVEMSGLVLGIADLFTVKMGETFSGLFRTQKPDYRVK
jgi:hypothetical protein